MKRKERYTNYTVSDFLEDDFFQSWVYHPNEQSSKFWEDFLIDFPEKRKVIEDARSMLESFSFKEEFPSGSIVNDRFNRVLAVISKREILHKPRVRRMNIIRWTAAASVILILCAGYFFTVLNKEGKPTVNEELVIYPAGILPGGNKAVLTLADGKQISLDEVDEGTLTMQGVSKVSKLNEGELVYENTKVETSQITYNTITTPRGGQYKLVLPDGSKVWLNAASSLYFPTSFKNVARNVVLHGEAYFEVAKDEAKPFTVVAGRASIEVLGTHFNVKAYPEEEDWQATLLEGAVKVSNGANGVVLKPGQQAVVKMTSQKIVVQESFDLEGVVAWKNGLFQFQNSDLRDVMLQIGRWYDLNVVFEGKEQDKKITGKIYRDADIKRVLELLKALKIDFTLKDKTIFIKN